MPVADLAEALDDLEDIDGLIHHGEGVQLAALAREATGPIVEIGSYKGQSACYLAVGSMHGHGVPVHCVDLWDKGGQTFARSGKTAPMYADRSVLRAFHDQTARAGVDHLIQAHRGASVDVAADWVEPVALLHIDGLHSYDGVRSDLEAWSPHLTPDAVVAFHDYCPKFPGVIEAVDEWTGYRVLHREDRLAWVQT